MGPTMTGPTGPYWTPRHGAKDPLVPEHHPKWFHETIPNSKLHVFPETGGEDSKGESDVWLIDGGFPAKERSSQFGQDDSDLGSVFIMCMFFCFPIAQLVYASFAHENWRNRHQEGKHNIHQKFADEFNRLVLEFFSE